MLPHHYWFTRNLLRHVGLMALGTVFLSSASIAASAQSAVVTHTPAVSTCVGSNLRWIASAGSLHHSIEAIPIEQQQQIFGTPCTFLIGKQNQEPYSTWASTGTISIKDFADASKCCESGVTAVLYDPESWAFTPEEEQRHPGDFACRIADIVHAKHAILITAPAVDILDKISTERGDRYDRFLRAGIVGSMAKCADVYEVQSQGTEPDTARFNAFVRAAAEQARKANPKIVFFAGLSTNPNGRSVAAEDLYRCVHAVSGVVNGFWLNIPEGGALCPHCGEAKPAVAADLLKLMAADLPGGGNPTP